MKDYRAAYNALMQCYTFTVEDIDGEEWRDIAGYEGIYQVSNFGRVKSYHRGKVRILKPLLDAFGYLGVNLRRNDRKLKRVKLHKLVANAFIPNPNNVSQINHIDGHKFNNHLSNLERCTPSENTKHAFDMGLAKNAQGVNDSQSKIKAKEDIIYIRNNPDGLTGRALAAKFDVSPKAISLIQIGRTYENVGGKIRKSKFKRTSEEIKRRIKAEIIKGDRQSGVRALARKYNVSHSVVLRILNEN